MPTRSFVVDQVQAFNGSDVRPLAMSALSPFRFDASWSPYIQATLTGAPPAAADLTAIDPRTGWRCRFRMRSFDGNGTQLASYSFNLGIRRRRRSYGAGASFSLDLATDEALLQDYFIGGTEDYAGGTAPTILASQWAQGILNIPGKTLVLIPGAPDVNVPSADAGYTADQNVWDYLTTMAEAAGSRVFYEEDGRLLWASPSYVADTATRTLDLLSSVDDVVDRDAPDWANFAVVTYQGNTPYQTSVSDSGLSPRKGIAVTRSRRKPSGTNAAIKIRTTAQSHGRNLTITAVADLTVRPLQRRTVAYQGAAWTGVVQSVAFDLPAGTMTVVLNVLE